MGNIIDLTGQKFGRLTVVSLAQVRKSNRVTWHCKCECGNEVDVIGSHLKTGHTKSCGCLQKEITSTMNPAIDITGQRFGKLVAIQRAQSRNKHTCWLCQCDCGNTCEVYTTSLVTGHTTSCGCIQSKGEEAIALWLYNHNIPFERQKIFDTCRNPKTNANLRFDFFVNNKFLLEYDGIAHYRATDGWNYEANVKEVQERDKIKDEWAINNNIHLYRLSHNDGYSNETLDKTLGAILEKEN